jgi:hypothetical protein
MHPVNIFTPYFPKIHSNIIFQSTPRCYEWSLLPFTFSDQNFYSFLISPMSGTWDQRMTKNIDLINIYDFYLNNFSIWWILNKKQGEKRCDCMLCNVCSVIIFASVLSWGTKEGWAQPVCIVTWNASEKCECCTVLYAVQCAVCALHCLIFCAMRSVRSTVLYSVRCAVCATLCYMLCHAQCALHCAICCAMRSVRYTVLFAVPCADDTIAHVLSSVSL